MRRTVGLGAFICSFVLSAGFLQERGWRGIVPLRSTRRDVERLVGPPMTPGGITYDLKTERVNVGYSVGGCEKGEEWNVPPGTVVMVRVYPQTKVMLSDLQIDLNTLKKFVDPHIEESIFVNEEAGISIRTTSGGEVVSLQYFPQAKDSHLRCTAVPQPGDVRKFDEYSNLPFSDEKARLDNFAIYLQKNEPTFKGYIIVYAGQRVRSGTAQVRAKRARDYLINERRIEAPRIVTIDGGCREKFQVELYALPSSMSPPSPTPCRKK